MLAGDISRDLGDYDTSEKLYLKAEALEPDYPNLYACLTEGYVYAGKPAKAEEYCYKGMKAEPDNVFMSINLAHALLLQGKRKEALALYKKLSPQPVHVHGYVGNVFLDDIANMRRLGINHPDFPLAEQTIKEAVKQTP